MKQIQIGDLVLFKNRVNPKAHSVDHLGQMIPPQSLAVVLNITTEKSCDTLDPDDWLNYEIFIPEEGIITSGWGERSIQKIDVSREEK